jgi:PqqD family protein of HPr-rel-A system
VTITPDRGWRLPPGQRLVFEDFEDGIVLFDALVGGTHLVNVTAAEALTIVEEAPGLSAAQIHARLLVRLALGADALPLDAIEELLRRLAALDLVADE